MAMFEERKAVRHMSHELKEMAKELEEDIEMLATEDILQELKEIEAELASK